MKIYEIGTGYTPIPAQMGAATEIVVEGLTEAFLKASKDVSIIDISASDRGENSLPVIEAKVPSLFTRKDVSLGIMHKLKRVVYSLSLSSVLKKILKSTSEKVVLHFHNQYNLFFFLKTVPKKLRDKALIAYTVHSYIWGTEWEEIEETVNKRYFQEITCVKSADLVFVLNDITIDHFVNRLGVDKDKIKKIINGVNTDKYIPLSEEEILLLKEKYDLKDKKVIFQVGSVCDRKNQLGTLNMLLPYLKEHKDTVFMYAGGIIDEEYQSNILSIAKENNLSDQVRYVGELPPGKVLNEYYNLADVSVFTSKLESFGLVIIEAISAGVPVVLSSAPMFELNDGYSVYNSDDEFVNHVLKYISQNSKVSRAEIIEKYSWDAVASEHLQLFESYK